MKGKAKLYTVYDNRTDMPVCVSEEYRRAAELMGVSSKSFHSIKSKCWSGKIKRWHIEAEDIEDGYNLSR